MTVTVAVPKIVPLVALTVLANTPVVLPAVKRPVPAMMLPGGLTVVQTGVIATALPFASWPTAVNCCVAPMSRVGFGVTVIVASGPAVTLTVAVPKIVPWVALTVFANGPVTVPAVKGAVSPVVPAGMVPPPAVTDQLGLIVTTLPLASLPTAVNVCRAPTASVTGFGVTVIVARAPGEMMTVAVTVIPPQVTDTVLVNVPATVPAVNNPVCEIVPPPATTDQVGVTARTLPFDALATAVNCCVPPMARVADVGVTVSDVTVRRSVELLQAAVKNPTNATATITLAMRAR